MAEIGHLRVVLVFQLKTPLEHVFDVVDLVLEQHPGLVEKLELDVSDIQVGS